MILKTIRGQLWPEKETIGENAELKSRRKICEGKEFRREISRREKWQRKLKLTNSKHHKIKGSCNVKKLKGVYVLREGKFIKARDYLKKKKSSFKPTCRTWLAQLEQKVEDYLYLNRKAFFMWDFPFLGPVPNFRVQSSIPCQFGLMMWGMGVGGPSRIHSILSNFKIQVRSLESCFMVKGWAEQTHGRQIPQSLKMQFPFLSVGHEQLQTRAVFRGMVYFETGSWNGKPKG